MKKIIWIAHEANISGANLCMLEYISILNKMGFYQIIVLPHKGNMQLVPTVINLETKIIPFYDWIRPKNDKFLSKNFFKRLLRNSFAFFNFCNLYLKTKPCIVCSNTIVHGIAAISAKAMFKTHLWFIHEMGEEDFGFKLSMGRLSYALMNFTSQKFLVNSVFISKKYKKFLPAKKIEIVYNPVLVDSTYTPICWKPGSTLYLLMLGQLSAIKGHKEAIKAVKILRNFGYDVKLNIYGKCEQPTYENELHDNIRKLELSDHVQIMGQTENPSKVITQHHILLICSIYEAMGRVSLEAMKLSVFVIGSDTGGTPELILDNKTGFLYKQGDPVSLSGRIIDYMKLENKNKIISAARKHALSLTENGIKHILGLINR